jgi:hypothetical protein
MIPISDEQAKLGQELLKTLRGIGSFIEKAVRRALEDRKSHAQWRGDGFFNSPVIELPHRLHKVPNQVNLNSVRQSFIDAVKRMDPPDAVVFAAYTRRMYGVYL